ncbi:MAG: TRAP transporter small permease [Rhodospirillaceae bacterium]|jgi:TRAP-type C4-dicarboxylate transport system permease small subunit|nr:TRAP transporter small permease [Rhodospirillaceae bacterium]MBT3887084.1 TRAP transporter small permease [Rhodospirillaceae bacterium]MBT4116060.1 TRAP transporter small permease [Rhodospirillaceae bacterium]MBT4673825.1 TRAP transporter small permease [Rhodospirillaceae bacterium]MBT4720446.1 TRAP transporter small permease [Rhodospirillaceae bacterium]
MLQILKKIDEAWAGLLWLGMAIASVYIGLIMVSIIYITTFRFFGAPYNVYTTSFIEYGFVYLMFLGSPWMVRNRAHVFIEMLTAAVSPRIRDILSRFIALAAAAVCLLWAWYTWVIFLEQFDDTMRFDELRAQLDIRLWVSTIAFPIGFAAMGIEFARFIFTAETMHVGLAGVANERVELEETKRDLLGDF